MVLKRRGDCVISQQRAVRRRFHDSLSTREENKARLPSRLITNAVAIYNRQVIPIRFHAG